MTNRVENIKNRLQTTFTPTHLEVIDQSHLHAGHAGAKAGGGHFEVHIQASAFEGKSLVEQHRLIYSALSDMMQTDIHALSIKIIKP
jgi:BolA protein